MARWQLEARDRHGNRLCATVVKATGATWPYEALHGTIGPCVPGVKPDGIYDFTVSAPNAVKDAQAELRALLADRGFAPVGRWTRF